MTDHWMDWKIKPTQKMINVTPLEPEPNEGADRQERINHYQSGALGLTTGLLLGWWLL